MRPSEECRTFTSPAVEVSFIPLPKSTFGGGAGIFAIKVLKRVLLLFNRA
jgi:hypothetical protein